MKKLTLSILLIVGIKTFAQKFENLAPTPPMGWNSWNTFQTNISEDLVKGVADNMVSSGMKDAGYTYIVLDDGWMTMQRDEKTGDLVPDPKKFPHGMKALVDYVHSKGLKFGLYNCAGTKTCAGYPGTRGYEYQDARFYASLNIDYLKFDWCYSDSLNAQEAYGTMSKALYTAKKPIVFSLCEWGSHQPWLWAAKDGELWRTTGDISSCYEGQKDMGGWKANCFMYIVDLNEPLRKYAGPNCWNDPDMLEVGNGMSEAEDRTHFSLWCMMASPLIAGNDIRKMSAATKATLTNKDVIAVDQDALGVQGWRYATKDSLETWFKPLSNGDWAVCFVNRSAQSQKINFDWKNENVNDDLSSKQLNGATTTYKIKDVWTKKDASTTAKAFSATVAPHDVIMLRLIKQ
ncbi:MAG: glycoside hydrolase family 27 protein [Parafilimonas sp.]|nr:glycoside hydrolase family 27 protein [Parafilimonas sp.]